MVQRNTLILHASPFMMHEVWGDADGDAHDLDGCAVWGWG